MTVGKSHVLTHTHLDPLVTIWTMDATWSTCNNCKTQEGKEPTWLGIPATAATGPLKYRDLWPRTVAAFLFDIFWDIFARWWVPWFHCQVGLYHIYIYSNICIWKGIYININIYYNIIYIYILIYIYIHTCWGYGRYTCRYNRIHTTYIYVLYIYIHIWITDGSWVLKNQLTTRVAAINSDFHGLSSRGRKNHKGQLAAGQKTQWPLIPSGNWAVCYCKWPIEIVDLPVQDGDLSIAMSYVRLPKGISYLDIIIPYYPYPMEL